MNKAVSIEKAMLLKKAGFWKKNARFYWSDSHDHPGTDDLLAELPHLVRFFRGDKGATLSIELDWHPTLKKRQYFCYYAKHLDHVAICHSELNDSLPEALADIWLWLKKEKYI